MALLMIKTRDLSWQDHTMNIEVMLAPSRNELLMSKHKTLASKCDNAKRLFERERESALKKFVTEKRIMERKRQTLLRRKSHILLKTTSSENEKAKDKEANLNETRGKSAPPRIVCEKAGSNSNSNIFLTEVTKSTTFSENNYPRNAVSTRSDSAKYSTTIPSVRSDSQSVSPALLSSRRVISPVGFRKSSNRVKSVRFDEKSKDSENIQSERPMSYCISTPDILNDRVKQFVQSQCEFNKKPPISYRRRGTEGYKAPLIAKKYTGFSYDVKSLEHAFEKFCLNRNKDEFQKLVRMATKMKNNVKLSRNQSIIPTVATFKASQTFKNLILTKDSSQSDS